MDSAPITGSIEGKNDDIKVAIAIKTMPIFVVRPFKMEQKLRIAYPETELRLCSVCLP